MHTDRSNHGDSLMFACGDYKGGLSMQRAPQVAVRNELDDAHAARPPRNARA